MNQLKPRPYVMTENMQNYIIEVRILGYSKKVIRRLVATIFRTFHLYNPTEDNIVPHITLVGPLETNNVEKLILEVGNIVREFNLIEFKFSNFGIFSDRAVCVNITPSKELTNMRNKLVEKLDTFCQLSMFDYESYIPHITLVRNINVKKDISHKFNKITKFLHKYDMPDSTKHVLRVTIINKNSEIIYEYDTMLKKILHGHEILDKDIQRTTMQKYYLTRKISENIEFK